MDIREISVPEVYRSESADFRFFIDWFSNCLSKVQYDTENLPDLYDCLRCPEWLLWMLGDTMGFKYDDRFPAAFNRLVLLYFMSMIRNKGSKDGVTLAAEVNLSQFNIFKYGQEDPILYNRLEDTSIPVNAVYVTPHVDEGYIDVVYFSENTPQDACIEYVRPLGMYLFQHPGARVDARMKLAIDARLTNNTNNLNMSIGPTHVGHYSREDYARLQKIVAKDRSSSRSYNSLSEFSDERSKLPNLYPRIDKDSGKVVYGEFEPAVFEPYPDPVVPEDEDAPVPVLPGDGHTSVRSFNFRNVPDLQLPPPPIRQPNTPSERSKETKREAYQREFKDFIREPFEHKRRPVYYRNSEFEKVPTGQDGSYYEYINPGYRALYSLQLCNNEHIVQSLLPSIYGLGFTPTSISTFGSVEGDTIPLTPTAPMPDESGHVPVRTKKVYNLRYDLKTDEKVLTVSDAGPDMSTIDVAKSESVPHDNYYSGTTSRPAVNPIMMSVGDAMSLNSDNTIYQLVTADGVYPVNTDISDDPGSPEDIRKFKLNDTTLSFEPVIESDEPDDSGV